MGWDCLAYKTYWLRDHFWPTVGLLLVVLLAHFVVCLSVCLSSVVCDVLYCGETVRISYKMSEGVSRKPGSNGLSSSKPCVYIVRLCGQN